MTTYGSENQGRSRPWSFFFAFALGAFLVALPVCKAPIKDEGAYVQIAEGFFRYGLDIFPRFDLTSTTISFAACGALVIHLFGNTLWALRAFVLVVSALGLFACVHLLRRVGTPPAQTLVFAAFVVVSPVFSRYAHLFTPENFFVLLCVLSLILYAIGLKGNKKGFLALGSLAATVAVYAKQTGLVLPAVPFLLLLWDRITRREPLRPAILLLIGLPYLAFLPLALFFHHHSGSFVMYMAKPWEHEIGALHPDHALWSVNFLGFFAIPFFYPILKGHWDLLRRARFAPLVLCLVLTPSALLGETTVVSSEGGLGRILAALPLPDFALTAFVLLMQFFGLLVLTLLALRALRSSHVDRVFLLFVLLYAAGLSTKGGALYVHYAAPLMPAAAWITATAYRREAWGSRWMVPLLLLLVASFSFLWAKAETLLGDTIHQGIDRVIADRDKTDRIYTTSATALQAVDRTFVTYDPKEATFCLVTSEDYLKNDIPSDFTLIQEFRATLFGRPVGRAAVYRRGPPSARKESDRPREVPSP